MLFVSQRRFEWCIELIVSLNEVEVFLIFHDEMENQKVVRLTKWVVESNSYQDFNEIGLKISGRIKFQVNLTTG